MRLAISERILLIAYFLLRFLFYINLNNWITVFFMEHKVQSFPTPAYLPALTGIRAIAAYMVYCVHFDPFEHYRTAPSGVAHFAYVFFQEFGIGVTMFFVLSGFLITLRYSETVKLEWQWFRTYIINRIARIYPMYFLLTALTFIAFSYDITYDTIGQYRAFNATERLVTQLLNFSLLRGFSETLKFSGIIQGWSLTVEECFYFSAPIFLVGISFRYCRIFIYPALIIALGMILTAICSRLNLWGIFGSFPFLFYYTFFGRCLEFFFGMALALYLRKIPKNPFNQSNSYTITGIVGILSIITLTAFNTTYPSIDVSFEASIVINNLLLPIFICLLYCGFIFENNILTRLLKSRIFDLLGKSSYTFYLIHLGVIQLFLHRHLTSNPLLLFLLLNVISVFLFKTIEEPCHKWLKSFSKPSLKEYLAPD